MTTITLPASVLVGIANLVHFTPQRKLDRDTSPILGTVQVTIEPRHPEPSPSPDGVDPSTAVLTAISTDRYMVGRYTVVLDADYVPAETVSFLLSVDLLKDAKPKPTDIDDWRIGLEEQGDREHNTAQYLHTKVILDNGVRAVNGFVVGGNYPPVARLIPGTDTTELADLQPEYLLNLDYVARIAKVVAPYGGRTPDNIWNITGTTGPNATDKPRPVVWTTEFGEHGYLVMLQPNMKLR